MYVCNTTPGGVLGISSNGDDRRIFLGLKFSIPEFFWVKNLRSIFWGQLDFSYGLLSVLKRIGTALVAA